MKDKKIYFHKGEPALTKLGTICGRDIYVQLDGDDESREHDYMLILTTIKVLFNPPEADHE